MTSIFLKLEVLDIINFTLGAAGVSSDSSKYSCALFCNSVKLLKKQFDPLGGSFF